MSDETAIPTEINPDTLIEGGEVVNPYEPAGCGIYHHRITHVEVENIKGRDKTGEQVRLNFESEDGPQYNWVLVFTFHTGRTLVSAEDTYDFGERENIRVTTTERQK